MGAWGTGLYQDDIAMEVREYYQELLKKGISNEESLECVLEAFEDALEDADDAPPFWFALADTQWKLGRLTDEVRAQALALLTSGADLARWEDATKAQKNARKKVLQALQERLQSPQPPEKKIRVPRLYHTDWKFGDLYAKLHCIKIPESHVCTIQTGNSGNFMQCSFAVKLRKPMVWVVGICCFIRSGRKNGIQAIQSQLCMLN